MKKSSYPWLKFKANVVFLFLGTLIWTGCLKTAIAYASAPTPIFSESFDSLSSIKANQGTSSGITLERGKSGKGVLIEGNGTLSYPVKDHFDFQKGTIEFWIKPKWDGNTTQSRWIYKIKWNSNQSLDIFLGHNPDLHGGTSENYLMVLFNDHGNPDRRTFSRVPMQWKPDEWHKVIIYWDFSIPADAKKNPQSYLVFRMDDIFANCVFVPPVVQEPLSSDARITVGQDNVVGRYPVNAVLDELRIYNVSLLPVVPFPAFQFNPQKPATEVTFRKLFANDGFCSPFKTYNDSPNDCPKLDDAIRPNETIFFFQRPAFERVYENYVPKEEEMHRTLNYQAAPGEFETLFFNVYSRLDLNNVTVTNTEFRGASGNIPRANLDLRVVRNWFQAGTFSVADQLPHYVPELLLHNDQIRYELDPTLSFTHIPSIPILDHVKTQIAQYTTRQFALLVKVPSDAPAGQYVCTVTLKANGIQAQNVTLNLEVLPFKLRDPGKRFTIFHGTWSSYLYARNNDAYRWEIFAKENQDIRNHGFNGLILSTVNDYLQFPHMKLFEVRKKKVEMARAAGFKWLVLEQVWDPKKFSQEITPAYRDLLVQNGFEPYFTGLYEISIGNKYLPDNFRNYIKVASLIHSIGAKVVGGGGRWVYERLNNPHDPIYASFPPGTREPFDWGTYFGYAPNAIGQYYVDIMRGERKKDPHMIETSYFSSQDENPQFDRYYCGYFLWVTGLDGCAPHAYQAQDGMNWYNDFAYRDQRRVRPGALTYPSKEGPVPTFQWEATREGIKDLKYLATWQYYRDQAAQTHPDLVRQSETVVNNLLEHYQDRDNTWNPAVFRVSMAQYEADRKTIINEIKKLQKVSE